MNVPADRPVFSIIAIVGAGAMGRGIAQIAAQAGSAVLLYDTQEGAAQKALAAIVEQWDKLAAKGRMKQDDVALCTARLKIAQNLQDLKDCQLVIEAVIERLPIKQEVFSQLEAICSPETILATNTSSLSVTAIAACLKNPERFAGYHFFNPVPLMKVVEVVKGLRTSEAACQALTQYASQMGHKPVQTGDTPGFIVNHAGRGYGTEALRIAGERVCDFAAIDRILKAQAQFKLGPFELLDLTALDVSHPVMESIYHQYYEEPRYRPSVITAQRLAGAALGRKSGQGFYAYVQGQAQMPPMPQPPAENTLGAPPPVWVSNKAARRVELLQLLKNLGAAIETSSAPSDQALILCAPLGLDVTTAAVLERLDPSRTVGIDALLSDEAVGCRVLALNPATRKDMADAAWALMARDGKAVHVIEDSAGFVTQRVLAAIINIACDMCQQGVCSPQDLDSAVTLGLGYPMGPLAWGDKLGAANLLETLLNMQLVYGDMRYRPSPWLRRRAELGLSLLHVRN